MEGNAKHFALGTLARRPLMGLTILLVEDSRYCSEAVRLMSQRSGARLRRADCLTAARRHLAIYRPDVVMVDIGLPDGSGIDLIREIGTTSRNSPAIIAVSGDDGGSSRRLALEAGACCFLTKPLQDIASFQKMITSVVEDSSEIKPFVPQVVSILPALDQQALVDDLTKVRTLLTPALDMRDRKKMRYLAQFCLSVAQATQDHELLDGASAFLARLNGGNKWQRSGARMLRLVKHRLSTPPLIWGIHEASKI